jgi:DNA-binding transcriptional ArsR family regulator
MKGTMSTHAADTIIHPDREQLELGAVLHALSDPVRLRIVAELASTEGEYTCGSFALPVTKSTCTHHFKVLREAGLIHQRPQGTTRLNRLRRQDIETRFPGLLETILRAAERAGADVAAQAAGDAKDAGAGPATTEYKLNEAAAPGAVA